VVRALDLWAYVSAVTLVTVWVLYPLVMGVLAALARRPVRGAGVRLEPAARSVSVVIATRDDPAAVRARVEDCLRASDVPAPIDVIVALDRRCAWESIETYGTTRGTVRFVRGDEPGGKAATLNAGVRAATGDVIVFADTSQRFHPDAVRVLVEALRERDMGAASGNLELPRANRATSLAALYWRAERWLRKCEATVGSAVGVTGAIYAIRKSLWQPLPVGLLLDDLYAPMQIVLRGYRVGFVDRALAWELRQPQPVEEYRRKTRTLTGVIQLCAWLPALLNPLRNPIWAQFLFHKLLRFLTPYAALGIGVWCLVTTWPKLTAPLGPSLSAAAAALLCLLFLSTDRAGRVRHVMGQAILLQAAVLVATFNGLRGRWDVWQK